MNKGTYLTALSAALYGLSGYFFISLLSRGLSISEILFWRFLVCGLVLVPFLPAAYKGMGKIGIKKKQIFFGLFCFGGSSYAVATAFSFESAKLIGTGLGMVIFFCYPIFVFLFSWLMDKSVLSRATLIALLFILVGCLLIAFGDKADMRLDVRGVILAILSGLVYAFYVLYTKSIGSRVSSIFATWLVCTSCTLGFGLYLLAAAETFHIPLDFWVWFYIACLAVVATVLPILLMLVGLRYISSSKASIITGIEPVVTLMIGVLVLHENVTLLQFAGTVLIIVAACMVSVQSEEGELK